MVRFLLAVLVFVWLLVGITALTSTSTVTGQNAAVRLPGNPIIRSGMQNLTGVDGDDINGPSLIKVPSWAKNRLGKYYLYFAAHHGSYIRLAYANRLQGPWTIYPGGALTMQQAGFDNHIASPDVHLDEANRQIIMYFHGTGRNYRGKGQPTRVALSHDGLRFDAKLQDLGDSYFRAFQWKSNCYVLARLGQVFRARSCAEPWQAAWERGGNPFTRGDGLLPRHVATLLEGDTLTVFYSRIGDAQERLLVSKIHLTTDWKNWRVSDPVLVLEPEETYEGADLPIKPSVEGRANGRLRELRDPAVYRENGHIYLLYSVAGESGVAIAELKIKR